MIASLHDHPIAIVGVGGIFPGSPTLNDFWNHILLSHDLADKPPDNRWILPVNKAYDPEIPKADKVYSQKACFIRNFKFEPERFPMDKTFLESLDPLFHITLHAGYDALHDADISTIDRENTSVIIGNIVLPTEYASAYARDHFESYFEEKLLNSTHINSSKVNPINRYVAGLPGGILASAFQLHGGYMTFDAACASSLYSIKCACNELLGGHANAVLAGGVSRPDSLYTQMGFSQLRALSPSGRCAPFDERSDGLVVGEGAGFFILKRLDDAMRDGNKIYALIKGIGLSNDVGGSLFAPDSNGQVQAIRAAYASSDIDPAHIDFIECHATGTPVGDAAEFKTLSECWKDIARTTPIPLGSVKSNVGHLLTGAGAAGLMKTLLAFQHKTLPPMANFHRPNPNLNFNSTPFEVLKSPKKWSEPDTVSHRRLAAVSAFGFGGINAHIILEEWQSSSPTITSGWIPTKTSDNDIPIAVTGMSATFGSDTDIHSFKKTLYSNVSDKSESNGFNGHNLSWGIEKSRIFKRHWGNNAFPSINPVETIRVPLKKFRIPPNELKDILPQQLLMLITAFDGVNNGGWREDLLQDSGVFIGIGLDMNTTNFQFRWYLDQVGSKWLKRLNPNAGEIEQVEFIEQLRSEFYPPLTANRTMGALGGIVASRIARQLRVGGPSFTISSEETSGISALQIASRMLQHGDIRQALVGAVDMNTDFRARLSDCDLFAKLAANTSSDCWKSMAASDGAIALVLKPLDTAEKDGDRILGILRSIDIKSRNSSIFRNRPVSSTAFAHSAFKSSSNEHIEISGVNIPPNHVMDSTEAGTENTPENLVKPSIGNVAEYTGFLGAASGLSAALKTLTHLSDHLISPCNSNSCISSTIPGGAMYPESLHYWLRNRADGPRSSRSICMGSGGNSSAIKIENDEKYRLERTDIPRHSNLPGIALITGNTSENFISKCQNFFEFIDQSRDMSPFEITASWYHRNPPQSDNKRAFRCAIVFTSHDALASKIKELVQQIKNGDSSHRINLPGSKANVFYCRPAVSPPQNIAFVYPGSGVQRPGMGVEISSAWPDIFECQDSANDFLRNQYLPETFWHSRAFSDDTNLVKDVVMGQVAFSTAMTDILATFNIHPHNTIGYSLGETSALVSLGAWYDRDLLYMRTHTSDLFSTELGGECRAAAMKWGLPKGQKVDWRTGLINAPADEILPLIADMEHVYLLIENSPSECVIGGEGQQVDRFISQHGPAFFPMRGVMTVHCEVLDPVKEKYRDFHRFPTRLPKNVSVYSTAYGQKYAVNQQSAADAITAQAAMTLDFPRVIRQAKSDGVDAFIEVGPGQSCRRMIDEIIRDNTIFNASASTPDRADPYTILKLVAQLAATGYSVTLDHYFLPAQNSAANETATESFIEVDTVIPEPNFQAIADQFQNKSHTESAGPKPHKQRVETPSKVSVERAVSSIPKADLIVDKEINDPLVRQWLTAEQAVGDAHERFLILQREMTENMSRVLEFQMKFQVGDYGDDYASMKRETYSGSKSTWAISAYSSSENREHKPPLYDPGPVFMDRDQCLEYALGSVASVLGSKFAPVDGFPTRVRLPDEPLMLVDRIISVKGEPLSMTHGTVITEHDILPDFWYLDNGRIPTCIAVEAGQADLFLSGYLGIDFKTKGVAVYRLLDAVVTFHSGLPEPGSTIRYEITIDDFFRQGNTYLFHFRFDSTINGHPFLSMRDGCAGFFSSKELDAGKGIVHSRMEKREIKGKISRDYHQLVPMTNESYSDSQLDALRAGNLAGCFGDRFANLPVENPPLLPDGRMRLIHRVSHIDNYGGRYGIGQIRAEADIHPNDWFLVCHFVDDQVMPGTLMYECCMHTFRIYLMRMGWIGESRDLVWEPVIGVNSRLKCRGQVTAVTQKAEYEVILKEIGYNPNAYAIADAFMYADGKCIVEITDMALQVTGLTKEKVETVWAQNQPTEITSSPPALFNRHHILAFATGNPSEAFGEPYRIFNDHRVIARLPGPPYSFLHRITAIDAEPWIMKSGGKIAAEYDIPPDEWYFNDNRSDIMPFCILLEIALQPCGWFAAYMGSALTSNEDLSFRNLGGSAIQYKPVTRYSNRLTTHVECTGVSSSGGMIIQHYSFELYDTSDLVYKGTTYFGFFTKESLRNQVGIRDAELFQSGVSRNADIDGRMEYPMQIPFPTGRLKMMNKIDILNPLGGPQGLGFVEGSKTIHSSEWFFKAHFYQDPVWPGSLGLEAMLQLLQPLVVRRLRLPPERTVFIAPAEHTEHRWIYRGQVIPSDKNVTVQAAVTAWDDGTRTVRADGFLTVDRRVIYEMRNFSLRAQLR